MKISSIVDTLFRKKNFERGTQLNSQMKRCLNVFDIMFIAIGHMIGAGIYVLTGEVIRNVAGPAIILSFIFAGIAALLSAFSYAEFGARFPRAGSAYTYTYVALGELWAFIVGWTVALEYMIANAAVARSWSAYFDVLVNKAVSRFILNTIGHLSSGTGFFAEYPDFLAFILLILVAIAVAIGSKFSANVNTGFVVLNLLVLSFVIVYGLTYADFGLWSGVNEHGISRFFPYGFGGAVQGAAACFFSFIGFEALATAGEEAKNPHRTIPLATFGSLGVIIVVYVLMASTLSLMVPYDEVDSTAAYAAAFEVKGAHVAKFVMSIGALAGMLNNLVTGAFALPRAVYAMADDGLIYGFFGVINSRTKMTPRKETPIATRQAVINMRENGMRGTEIAMTPLNATIVFTLINAVLALVFDLNALVEFLSIGTLLAYSMVSACVILLRYQRALLDDSDTEYDNGGTLKSWVPWRHIWDKFPHGRSIQVALVALLSGYVLLALPFKLQIYTNAGGIIILILGAIISLASFLFILGHEQNIASSTYKVPFVPFIPGIGLLINVFMMVFLNYLTWVRLFVWLAIGLLIYFAYGVRHSKEGRKSAIATISIEPIGSEKPI